MTNEELEAKVLELERQMQLKVALWRWRFVYPLVAVFVSMFVAVATSIAYTTQAVHENEQTWCELVANLDDQNQKTPPPSENGKVFARQMHAIRIKFKCK